MFFSFPGSIILHPLSFLSTQLRQRDYVCLWLRGNSGGGGGRLRGDSGGGGIALVDLGGRSLRLRGDGGGGFEEIAVVVG